MKKLLNKIKCWIGWHEYRVEKMLDHEIGFPSEILDRNIRKLAVNKCWHCNGIKYEDITSVLIIAKLIEGDTITFDLPPRFYTSPRISCPHDTISAENICEDCKEVVDR